MHIVGTRYLGTPLMGRKVRKTLNIDAEKLRQAREYLELDTETEVIDRLLDDLVWERRLLEVLRSAPKSHETSRGRSLPHSPLDLMVPTVTLPFRRCSWSPRCPARARRNWARGLPRHVILRCHGN